ncbi:hypothetical protein GCM10010172_44720 [Paractinoplanes ferrugineus]|uniref:Uncharacterized protein n=1 Tax=Paractinoplanes ferrugineus TaxID=113564 RepID=A0A919IZQ6_9ACTN|nr:hypothetical protein Afe05nite_30530 [Actinoplanes ferrugineus]
MADRPFGAARRFGAARLSGWEHQGRATGLDRAGAGRGGADHQRALGIDAEHAAGA